MNYETRSILMIIATAVLHMWIYQRIQLPESEIHPPWDNDDICYNGTLHDGGENVALGFV